MNVDNFNIKARDGLDIFVRKWSGKSTNTKGIIQIIHGMAEHSGRYIDLARILIKKGFIVYANDHRGHGKTAGSPEKVGYLGEENGWALMVEDLYRLTSLIKKENNIDRIFLLGHSMGSLLARNYIYLYGNEVNGVILSGTSGNPGFLGNLGILLAWWEMITKGKKARSHLLNKLAFANYNKSFEPVRTKFDWLSSDEQEVEKYIKDPYCGTVFTAGFFYELLKGLKTINRRENISKIPKDLPIYLMSGSEDPVGDETEGVFEVYQDYEKAGLMDLSYKFYTGDRHEILNELNRHEVYDDIIKWLNNHC